MGAIVPAELGFEQGGEAPGQAAGPPARLRYSRDELLDLAGACSGSVPSYAIDFVIARQG